MSIDKHKFLVLFSYIGTKYCGIQRQTVRKLKEPKSSATDNSVQYFIEEALETINPKPSQEVKLSVSSRTDRGVHAFENSGHLSIVHPNGPEETYSPSQIIETANEYFKIHNHDIKLNKIHLVSPEFHLRKHIKWRSYYYRLAVVKPEIANQAAFQPESYLPINELNRCSLLRVPINLDFNLMQETVDSFKGTHDFTNFAAFSRTISYYYTDQFKRTIDRFDLSKVETEHLEAIDPSYRNINLFEFNITSKSFLYRQIRRMVGTAIMVGSGRFPIEKCKLMLSDPAKNKWTSNMFTAPGEGLYLSRIKYDPKDFLNPTNIRSLYRFANLEQNIESEAEKRDQPSPFDQNVNNGDNADATDYENNFVGEIDSQESAEDDFFKRF